ncbi:MAG: hypothetical protein K0R97_440 [Oerskovia sp.]|jgi:hypothetical protein|nr:hypothetical protein [Oerskovia sp.]
MLLTRQTLSGLEDGTVSLAYRRWLAPRVRAGGRMRTRVGVVEVTSIDRVAEVDGVPVLPDDDARAAGFRSAAAALAWVAAKGEGDLYRIGLRRVGEDPRIALRQEADLSADEVEALRARLARMDRAAPAPWTRDYLDLIVARPEVVARELATSIGVERDYFKIRVRRLKELGLTESLPVGYRISPRGRAYLDAT